MRELKYDAKKKHNLGCYLPVHDLITEIYIKLKAKHLWYKLLGKNIGKKA
jgi:hypothetical protein